MSTVQWFKITFNSYSVGTLPTDVINTPEYSANADMSKSKVEVSNPDDFFHINGKVLTTTVASDTDEVRASVYYTIKDELDVSDPNKKAITVKATRKAYPGEPGPFPDLDIYIVPDHIKPPGPVV